METWALGKVKTNFFFIKVKASVYRFPFLKIYETAWQLKAVSHTDPVGVGVWGSTDFVKSWSHALESFHAQAQMLRDVEKFLLHKR